MAEPDSFHGPSTESYLEGDSAMPPVRRHRIGDQMPAVTHPGPDSSAIALCRDLVAEPPVHCAILFGSRALGGWDDQSDLDIIVIHQPCR